MTASASLTQPRAGPVFRASTDNPSVAHVALVSLTVTRATIVYTNVYCPNCRKRVMSVPNSPVVEVHIVASDAERSGRGRVVKCNRGGCQSLLEVIEHA